VESVRFLTWLKRLLLPAMVSLTLGSTSSVAAPSTTDNRLPGLSGYWRLKDKGTVQPVLTARAKTEKAKPDRRGDIDVESDRWCIYQGMPYVMSSAGPIEIRQSPGETIIVAERLAVPRHIYHQLKKRPSPDVFDFTPVGLSTGRREGDALVVETDMFSEGLGPDGVPRTEKTKLVERFHVSKDGTALAVTSTWKDPGVFVKPYVYTWTYERIPEDYTVVEHYCDPRANGVGNYPPGEDPREKQPAS
jgi:hypothetical protein